MESKTETLLNGIFFYQGQDLYFFPIKIKSHSFLQTFSNEFLKFYT